MEENKRRFIAGLELSVIVQAIAQLIIGLLLAIWYRAGVNAYDSVHGMRQGWLVDRLAGLHYWGSLVLIISSFVLILAGIFASSYKFRIRQWYGALLAFLAAYGGQVSGNLLPMDRHGVQTAVIETGLMQTVPGVGKSLRQFALGGAQLTPATDVRWYVLHGVLITLLFLAAAMLLWPARKKFGAGETRSSGSVWLPIVALAALALIFAPPLGLKAGSDDFTSYNAFVSWYTWPLHGSLQAFTKLSLSLGWVGFAGIPGLFVAFLAILPIIGRKLKKAVPQGVFILFILFFGFAGLAFGGPIAKLVGNRDPAAEQVAIIHGEKLEGAALAQRLAEAAAGRGLFNSIGCSGCHGENGDSGSVGPTLTNEGSKESIDWLERFIRNPKSLRPASTMPSFGDQSKEEIRKIAEWVSLDPQLKRQVIASKP